MRRNTTFNLPDGLIRRGKAYAAAHGTTLTEIVRTHLEKVTGLPRGDDARDVLALFSQGRVSKGKAVRELGLVDYSDLLLALGQRGLPLPMLAPHLEEEMVETFLRVSGLEPSVLAARGP